jgi:hypothetical protein
VEGGEALLPLYATALAALLARCHAVRSAAEDGGEEDDDDEDGDGDGDGDGDNQHPSHRLCFADEREAARAAPAVSGARVSAGGALSRLLSVGPTAAAIIGAA